MTAIDPPHILRPDFTPRIREGVHVDTIGNEGIAWPIDHPTPTYLDPVALLLTSVFDGSASTEELTEDVHEALGVELGLAQTQLHRVIQILSAGSLLDIDGADPVFELPAGGLPAPDF